MVLRRRLLFRMQLPNLRASMALLPLLLSEARVWAVMGRWLVTGSSAKSIRVPCLRL